MSLTFLIREVDRAVFAALKNGTKKVETRAAKQKYRNLQAGDEAVFECGGDRLVKKTIAAQTFSSIGKLLEKYAVKDIAPWLETSEELENMIMAFPGYTEEISKYGVVAIELE